jgi:starch synthase (maltosyl-transferring)
MKARPRARRRQSRARRRLSLTQTVVIESIQPAVDGGRYPAKSEVGQLVEVGADIFKEGHDVLVAAIRYRGPGDRVWRQAPMHHVDNDRWAGSFPLEQNGRYVFAIEAVPDPFLSWLADLDKRTEAGGDVASELLEGRALIEVAARRARGGAARDLRATVDRLAAARSQADAVAVAHEPALAAHMARLLDWRRATRSERQYVVMADRERARFAAWYELFPRSARGDGLPATFKDAEGQLERIAAMGFDTVYLPPIHPIGHSFRKGRNNALTAGAGDPGSPWAIGSEEGGHMAVHRELGTLEDFDRFVEAAERLGLEVALDFAIQCSADHPYVREHPEWFFHRPDGTIKYAENPPKKYQDVYPVNFYGADPKPLWEEMRRIVEFWIAHGVRAFRVDNPHTKPVPFWEWLIREIQRARPDVIFLAEAFTRPKMMKVLAKVGFTQSYTYFTWRNAKAELVDYLEEITRPPVADYFRGNLWPNTPDILHETLQRGGRAAFKMRLVLAATLSSLYGIYSGYELGENVPLREGSEEYLDSEKYEIKARDWNAPGNLGEFVTAINRIRRQNRALSFYRNLRFYGADDPNIVWYGKMTPEGDNVVFVAANLDVGGPHASLVDVPLAELGLGADEPYVMHELLSDRRYEWRGPRGYVVLDPAIDAAQIFAFHRMV